MTTVTSQNIEQFRSKLAGYPSAQKALEVIEDCEGNLEDAAMSLAIRAGQQPQLDNAEWLETLAKKCRSQICRETIREYLNEGNWEQAVKEIADVKIIPEVLITPVLMYVLQQNLQDFCRPLELKKQ